jgi:SAM-dependent methyltransferase
MTSVFGAQYAAAYDAVYGPKDYGAECDLLERLFREYGSGVRRVLDLGCGTGSHAVVLAERGYDVVGVDRSEEMLAQAVEKAPTARFVRGDVRSVELGETFDAALMMFAVLGYQLETGDVLAALATARRHLDEGGLLLFDVWYGPAVLTQRPERRVLRLPLADGAELVRTSSGRLDSARDRCSVRIEVARVEGGTVVSETEETHDVRYFFPSELRLLLGLSGFELVRTGAFPDFDRDPDDATWNVLAAARAVALA